MIDTDALPIKVEFVGKTKRDEVLAELREQLKDH